MNVTFWQVPPLTVPRSAAESLTAALSAALPGNPGAALPFRQKLTAMTARLLCKSLRNDSQWQYRMAVSPSVMPGVDYYVEYYVRDNPGQPWAVNSCARPPCLFCMEKHECNVFLCSVQSFVQTLQPKLTLHSADGYYYLHESANATHRRARR